MITSGYIKVSEIDDLNIEFIDQLWGTSENKKGSYEEQFKVIWRKRFLDNNVPEDLIESIVDAEYHRYLRREKDYWEGQGFWKNFPSRK